MTEDELSRRTANEYGTDEAIADVVDGLVSIGNIFKRLALYDEAEIHAGGRVQRADSPLGEERTMPSAS